MPDANEWTFTTIKEYFVALLDAQDKRNEQRFDAQEEAVRAALESAKQAVQKAEVASEKRFDNTNEWRQSMNDRDARTPTRLEVDAKFETFATKLDAIASRLDKIEGRSSGFSAGYGYVIAAIMTAIAIYGLIHGK